MSLWHTLLSDDGAEWRDDTIIAFPQTLQASQTTRVPLLSQTLLTVTGQKPADFLQGQVTCDMRQTSSERAIFGAHCTPKGRAVFDFVAWKYDEAVLLRQDTQLSEITQSHLERYGVFSRIKVSKQAWYGIGLCGSQAATLIEQHLGICANETSSLAEGQASVTQCEGGCILALTHPDSQSDTLFEVWLSEAQALAFWQAIRADTSPAPPSVWRHRLIQRGICQLNAVTSGEYIPQQLNMDLTQAISFKKGCYTGQEVIARLHYKGDSKKRLGLFHTFSESPLTSGQALFGNTGAKVGEIVNAAPMITDPLEPQESSKTPWGILAVVPKDTIHGMGEALLFLESDGSYPLQSYALPFDISKAQGL